MNSFDHHQQDDVLRTCYVNNQGVPYIKFCNVRVFLAKRKNVENNPNLSSQKDVFTWDESVRAEESKDNGNSSLYPGTPGSIKPRLSYNSGVQTKENSRGVNICFVTLVFDFGEENHKFWQR